jgi:hypothetical protein
MTNRAMKRPSEEPAEPDPPASKRRGGQPPAREKRTADAELAALANVTVGPAALAEMLAMTAANATRLAQRGIVIRVGTGRYSLIASCTNYFKFLKATGRGGSGEEASSAKSRFQLARAQIAEAEARARAAELVDAEAVDDAWAAIVSNVRARLLPLPAKIAPLAHGARTLAEAASVVKDAVDEALIGIARQPVIGIDAAPGRPITRLA